MENLTPEQITEVASKLNFDNLPNNMSGHVLELIALAIVILKDSKGRLREKHLVSLMNFANPKHPHFEYLRALPRHKGYTGPLLGPCVKAALKNHSDIVTYKIGAARFYEIKTV